MQRETADGKYRKAPVGFPRGLCVTFGVIMNIREYRKILSLGKFPLVRLVVLPVECLRPDKG